MLYLVEASDALPFLLDMCTSESMIITVYDVVTPTVKADFIVYCSLRSLLSESFL